MAKQLQYMDALGPTIAKARFAAEGGDVAAEEARLMNPDYVAPGVMEQSTGTLQAYTPTMRENAESKIAGALESIGMSKQSARDSAIGFTGTMDSSRGGLGVGVLDFAAPFSIPTAVQEAGREVKAIRNDPNSSGTDYIMPALTVGLSVAESLPLAKAATAPLKGFIKNLAAKSKPVAEPLIAAAGPMIPRRTFVQGVAATPVAGALSKLPLGKVDEVAKVAKAVKVALPKSIFDLPALISQRDEAIDLGFRENIDMFDEDEVAEILSGYYDEDQLIDFGIDPDDITNYDLLNENVVADLKDDLQMNPNAGFDEQSLLEEIDDELQDYLNGKLELDDLDQGVGGSYNIVKSLTEDYGLDRAGIREFLEKADDVSDAYPKILVDAYERASAKDAKIYIDLLKNPSNYKIKSYSFLGERQYYFEASDGPFEGEAFFEGFATRKVEANEAKSWLKNLVKENK